MLNRAEIEGFLPHRSPMLLLDRVGLLEDGAAHGEYRVRGDEFFLSGHFPSKPVVPGVILCEIIAQTAGILVKGLLESGLMPLFTGMEKVRFRRQVKPNDLVETRVRLLKASGMLLKIEGSALVEGQVAAQGEFLLMLTRKEG